MKKFRKLAAALCAAFVLLISFSTVAYAGGGEETEETTETAVTESVIDETNPLTPDGTGTVLDSATSADGKQFYTITTPAGNIFYLIIDLERDSENVYFLDAVTEKDLLALAEQSEDTGNGDSTSAIPDTNTAAETTPEPEAESGSDTDTEAEAETDSGGGISIVLVVLIVLAAGGAGYYFKIYRPKQQQADSEEDYDYEADEADPYGEDAEPEDDTQLWDEADTEYGVDSGDDEV